MTNEDVTFVLICDGGWRSSLGIWPWLSTLLVPIIGFRSLFLLTIRGSEKAKRSAQRCYLWLHIQSAFCMIFSTWIVLSYMFACRDRFCDVEASVSFQCMNMSHFLWVIVWQCFIATICALVVAACSGFRPRLWQAKYSMVSILLCATAQAISFGMFGIMRN